MRVYIKTRPSSRFLGRDFILTGVTEVLYDRRGLLTVSNEGKGVKGTRSYLFTDIESIEITDGGLVESVQTEKEIEDVLSAQGNQ